MCQLYVLIFIAGSIEFCSVFYNVFYAVVYCFNIHSFIYIYYIYFIYSLFIYNYRKIESRDGSKLLSLSDFHLGSDANVLISHPLLALPSSFVPPPSQQQVNNFGMMMPPAPPMPGQGVMGGFGGPGQGILPPFNGAPPPPPLPYGNINNSTLSTGNKRRQSHNQLGMENGGLSTFPFGTFYEKSNFNKTGVLVGTVDGGVGVLLPIDERIYRTLSLLQQLMAMSVRTMCLLNQRDFRLMKTNFIKLEKKKGVLDGTLLWKYVNLPIALQNDLATVIGTTPDVILEHLASIDSSISFF